MNFQEQKQLLQKHLGRLISDAVFYRIRKDLSKFGFEPDGYPALFPLIGEFNKNRRNIVVPPENVLKIFQEYRNAETNMTCQEFQIWLEKSMIHKPKPRKVRNREYMSPTWYEWFQLAGIPYEKDTKYSFEKYMIVLAYALIWDYRKVKKSELIVYQAS